MRKEVFHLANCNTCQKIMNEVGVDDSFKVQEIKTESITAKQLDEMIEMQGSAEELFSRRAMKYRSLGLNEQTLTEKDYRKYILAEYTFLKRPVFIIDNQIFAGNAKKTIEAIKLASKNS